MKKTPTDLELLSIIYDMYYDQFRGFSEGTRNRESKIYVPINCDAVAQKLGVDGDIVFGRLYYDLEKKYGYTKNNDANVHFFTLKIGRDSHCVNFPLLSSVLAGLRHDNKRFVTTSAISVIAIIVSCISLGVSIVPLLKASG